MFLKFHINIFRLVNNRFDIHQLLSIVDEKRKTCVLLMASNSGANVARHDLKLQYVTFRPGQESVLLVVFSSPSAGQVPTPAVVTHFDEL